MDMRESMVVRLEGSAGDGILSMGTIVAKAAARCGFSVCTLSSFLAEVRGGQSTFQLKLGCQEVSSPGNAPDIVVALNAQAVVDQAPALAESGLMICPPNIAETPGHVVPLAVDFDELSTKESGATRNRNLVAAGLLMALLGIDESSALRVVHDQFNKKGEAVAEAAQRALRAGFASLPTPNAELARWRLAPSQGASRLLISGNEAVALGAIVGGVRFYAGYPITPASEIMEVTAKHLPEVGGRSVQAEDEIASLGMCIGAAFGGAKTLTATSGPGLSLMTELLGLAAMAELPIVVVDVQRAGPSTGMPTKDGQGDLNIAVYGAHGDAPRVVLAPQSVSDCFNDTIRAVNIAHQFHVPVIVLSSQSLSHRMQTVALPALDELTLYDEPLFSSSGEASTAYCRFASTIDGQSSKRSVPGTPGGMYRTGGLEHDSFGHPSFEPTQRIANNTRRRQRMEAVEHHFANSAMADRAVIGRQPFGIVSWGTTAGAAMEAVQELKAEGWDFGYLFPRVLWPLPTSALAELIGSGIRTLYVCEANDSQQFAQLIRANCVSDLSAHGVEIVGITRDDGVPYSSAEIKLALLHAVSKKADNLMQAAG
jgi:2-oxoglutarate/2-oxoacid ferredoxin oxidoreductase subunit alpha